jgi:YEATS domain-containing protein 4
MNIEENQTPINNSEEIVFPYIYGSLAFSMGKKGDNYTHKWICYVRGVNNEDLSYLIEKVVFTLHTSFTNPVRCTSSFHSEVYRPPYEIQEVGWGEFEILVRVHFNHPDMPPVELPHMLKVPLH